MKATVNSNLPRKTAKIPFKYLKNPKSKYVLIEGEKTVITRLDVNFDDENIELDPQTYATVGEDVSIQIIDDLPPADEVEITIKGPYQPGDPAALLINMPFIKGETYKIAAYEVTIDSASHEKFVVTSMTSIKSNFIQYTTDAIDIMDDVYEKISRTIDVVSKSTCPKGIIISGPHGSGKTYFLKKLKAVMPTDFIVFTILNVKDGTKLIPNFLKAASEAVKDGKKIIIDDLDEILAACPKFEKILTYTFDEDPTPVIIATAKNISKIPKQLLSPCRFGVHITTRLPTAEERYILLKSMGIDSKKIAKELEGYSIGDVYKIITNMIVDNIPITEENVKKYKKKVPPTTIMNYQIEIPDVKWEDVGGLENAKKELKKAVEWPLKHPELFKKVGIKPPHGILLHGPPGTGKTLLAKAVATESGANFISVRAPEILDKYYGVSEARIKEIFERARASKPAIIFIDEIDAIGVRRGTTNHGIDSIINQLLVEMDGITENDGIIVIAATNRPDVLDPALLRPGRFEKKILVPLPDEEGRKEIFKVHLRGKPVSPDVKIEDLAYYTQGMSGAQIEAIVREAAYKAIERSIKEDVPLEITMKDLIDSIKEVGGVEIENR